MLTLVGSDRFRRLAIGAMLIAALVLGVSAVTATCDYDAMLRFWHPDFFPYVWPGDKCHDVWDLGLQELDRRPTGWPF